MPSFEPLQTEVRFISGTKNFVSDEKETNTDNPYRVAGGLILSYFQKRIVATEKMNERLKRVLVI